MTMTEDTAETAMVPLEQAAAQLATTSLNVLMHLKRGMLAGVETADGWEVTADSLAALLRQWTDDAAPLICKSSCGKAGGCGCAT
jgi:hypothetical protein